MPCSSRCLEAKRRILGPEHPETLELDGVPWRRGSDFWASSTRPANYSSRCWRPRVLGPEHLVTLGVMHQLAGCF